ncbi:MAG TPA: copper homeostasis protein CutC [Candidatus Coprenecus merdigallinarum]|nr:copper homeostasis protein CutC [Candidatus Coprenecus merdigallinarum]
MYNHHTIEICAPSYESALAAQRGGAARIELCSELDAGGVTPSYGLIQGVRAALTIAVNVLIRPRSGDFLYSSCEVETVTRDIALCAQAGVQGVVVGALTADAKVDRTAAAEWLKEARRHGLSATFHRAIDCTDDIYDALEEVASLGYDRVLTSGGCPTAWEGRETIARMQAMMANHTGSSRKPLIIMPGSGVNPTNIRDLVLQTGVSEVHLSATKRHKSGMRVLSGIAREETIVHSDEETVRRAVAALC